MSAKALAILVGGGPARRTVGREHGVALLAEGLIERLDPDTLGGVKHDPYGNVRLEELELSRLLKERVVGSLRPRGIKTTIVAKDIGYELRCAPPGGFDIHYCRGLGLLGTGQCGRSNPLGMLRLTVDLVLCGTIRR